MKKLKVDQVDSLMKDYVEKKRPELAKRIEKFKSCPLDVKVSLWRRPHNVQLSVQKYEPYFLPLLTDCSTLDKVIDKLSDFFKSHQIKYVGEDVIMSYAEHYAYINDLEMEANCACLLKKEAKRQMKKVGLEMDDFQFRLRESHPALKELSEREMVDFLNKNAKQIF